MSHSSKNPMTRTQLSLVLGREISEREFELLLVRQQKALFTASLTPQGKVSADAHFREVMKETIELEALLQKKNELAL